MYVFLTINDIFNDITLTQFLSNVFQNEGNDFNWATIIGSGITAAIVTSLFNLYNNKRNLQDSLDGKSGWRKEIFKVASKTYLSTDDIYLILAALRYEPLEIWRKNLNNEPRDFNEMTAYIHYKLNSMLKNYDYNNMKKFNKRKNICEVNTYTLDEIDADVVRIISKYLLKHHWENLGNGYFGRLKFKVMKENKIIKEVYLKIESEKR